MAQRITITIADELYERLQKVKSGLNISGLCQEAIDTAVLIEELKSKPQSMEVLIERLKLEKQQASEEWKKNGFTDGQEDALELSFEEFRDLDSKKEINEDLYEWLKDRHLEHLDNPDEDAYLEGWLKGALDVWEKVKNEL